MRLRTIYIPEFRHLKEVVIDDLAEINIFAGPNNAGKTSILRAIRNAVVRLEQGQTLENNTALSLGIAFEERFLRPSGGRSHLDVLNRCSIVPSFADLCKSEPVSRSARIELWGTKRDLEELLQNRLPLQRSTHRLQSLGNSDTHRLEDASSLTSSLGPRETKFLDIDTNVVQSGLREWLERSFFLWHRRKSEYRDKLQHQDRLDPDAEHLAARLSHLRDEQSIARSIQNFIEYVIPGLGEVKNKRFADNTVQIEVGGIPLSDHGGGLEQILNLAVVLLGEPDDCGVFLEEPETHLHPGAQRRLIEQIIEHRGNRQIFLTTHSPFFLNGFGEEANIYRVTRDAKNVRVELCIHRSHQRHALDELGVAPSSLLQTNCAIWVEGPTERILIRYWLELLAPELREHQHYEFLHTAGSLLAYLGGDASSDEAESTEERADIFQVCRRNIVVCDRDAGPAEDAAKAHVVCLRELASNNDHLTVLITYYYEIEWYFPKAVVAKFWPGAEDKMFTNRGFGCKQFYKELAGTNINGTKTAEQRKATYARWACDCLPTERASEVWFGDERGENLKELIEKIADEIRKANSIC